VITLLTIKKVLKKIWVWIRHNWYIPAVLVYTLVLYFLFNKKGQALSVLYERNESYKKQIKAINEIHEEEIERRDQILETYDSILEDLEDKYEEDNRKIRF